MGAILQEVERKYGPRDLTYTPLGVEFYGERPGIWFPGNCKHVAIRLSMSAVGNLPIAIYQLAHECVHLLSPSGGSDATVLEEGLATHFSEDYASRMYGKPFPPELPEYDRAARALRELLAIEPWAVERLRRVEPAFSKMDADTFTRAELGKVQHDLRDRLLTRFSDFHAN
ncbi:hypothetical protein [Paraburkholderia terrae]